jgi:hypothetical protein
MDQNTTTTTTVPDGPAQTHELGCDCARCWVDFRDWWSKSQVQVSGLALFNVFKAGCAAMRAERKRACEVVSDRVRRQLAEAAAAAAAAEATR